MGLPSQNDGVNLGALKPSTTWGEYNQIAFIIQQSLSKIQTATLVQVVACSNSGGVSAVGTVDIQPLVNQIDGGDNPIPHLTVYNVPYLRIQGGLNAVIIDPQPGDIGIAIFASRDITKVKSTKAQGNPGSYRQFDFADALYLGGLLNGVPQQYVELASSGITLNTSGTITLNGSSIVLNGPVSQSGGNVTIAQNLTVSGDATASGTSLHTHIHSGVQSGASTSGKPV